MGKKVQHIKNITCNQSNISLRFKFRQVSGDLAKTVSNVSDDLQVLNHLKVKTKTIVNL